MTKIDETGKIDEVVLIGKFPWYIIRDILVDNLINCTSEKDFTEIIKGLLIGIGTEEQIEATRKKLGIDKLNKQEKKKIRGK